MNDDIYDVILQSRNVKSIENKFDIDVLRANSIGLRLIKVFFNIIKNEMDEISIETYDGSEEQSSTFKKNVAVLNNFFGSKIEDNVELEKEILHKINKLKEFKFYKNLWTTKIEEFIKDLKSLRLSRVKIWEDILADFKRYKKDYLRELIKLNNFKKESIR